MMPGITYLPCRSMIWVEASVLSSLARPTQRMRPLSMIIAACTTGARPVPSINVKFFKALISATREVADKTTTQNRTLFRIRPGIFENRGGARRMENTTGAKTREVSRRLLRSPAILFDEVDHLLGQRMADHSMSAHGRKSRNLRVRNFLCLAFKAQRVAYAMPVEAGEFAAAFRTLDGSGDVHAHPEVFFLDALDELLRSGSIV